MFDFSKKITSDREFNSKSRAPEYLMFDYESDRGRIINSAAVRRLQQKTQVFPLERNAAVRSRLTHSLEVQQTGRFIVQTIFKELKNSNRLASSGLSDYERPLETLVEMSCLMHDIGNPPFGHFGEQAINNWFSDKVDSLFSFSDISLKNDICEFEGNAQAIRIIHTLLQLNLTYTQAAGIMKYTRKGTMPRPTSDHPLSYIQKKVGFYKSEEQYIEQLCKKLNIAEGHRHPISYIMEAADDISYCLADLEDAVEKGILSIKQLVDALNEEFETLQTEFSLQKHAIDMQTYTSKALDSLSKQLYPNDGHFFVALRVNCIHPLVKHASNRFIDNIEACYEGHFNQALLEDNSHAHALSECFKRVAIKYAFCHKEVEAMELQGYRIITGLLDCYEPILQASRQQFADILAGKKTPLLLAKRMLNKLPTKHLNAYKKVLNNDLSDELEFYYRCRLIQDNISGMTDQFAYDEYRHLMVLD